MMLSAAVNPSVQLEQVSKHFDDVVAVRELNLALEPGEFFTLLGPSGCGKTTTLRMVAGFEQPTSGRVLIDGDDVAGMPAFRRPTNTVFQSYALFPHLSVWNNVAFGLKRKKVQGGEIATRVNSELERVGLTAEAQRRPNQLSGGQQQRVALARALVNLPKVLLLDEPLGALDLKLRKGLQVELKRIQREVGITFVYVTHDQEEALTMSDRIAIMNRGDVEQIGSPEDVYERPETPFVAGFIGVSNLLPQEVISVNGGGAGSYTCVRPEKLRVEDPSSPATDGHPSVEGTIQSTLYLGTATQLIVEVADRVPMTVLVPNADEDERSKLPSAGSRVRLAWAPEHMHVVHQKESTLKKLLTGIALLVVALGASACGSDLGGGGIEGDVTTAESEGEATGDLRISNWPFYIDKDTVGEFEKETGLKVELHRGRQRQQRVLREGPARTAERRVGRPRHLRRHRLDGREDVRPRVSPELRQGGDPELRGEPDANLESPSFDPERNFSAPWQSGMTGLIVNKDLAPDITSIEDIFDPKYKGEIEVLTELRDTVPLIMKSEGVDVENATKEDWLAAIDKLGKAVDDGQIVDFTGNDYTADLARGDVAAVIGWSGDAVQLQADNPSIEWRMPEEGCIQWSDNMVIPVGRPEPDGVVRVDRLRLRPGEPGADHGLQLLRLPGRRRRTRSSRSRARTRRRATWSSQRGVHRRLLLAAEPAGGGRAGDRARLPAGGHRVTPPSEAEAPHPVLPPRAGDRLAVRLLRHPDGVHGVHLAERGHPRRRLQFTWNFDNYSTALTDYQTQFLRSFFYAGVATSPRSSSATHWHTRSRSRAALEDGTAVHRDRAVLHHLPDPDPRLADDPRRRGDVRRLSAHDRDRGRRRRGARHQRHR